MKKKLLVMAMSLAMIATIFTGCNKTDSAEIDVESSTQEKMEETLDEFSDTVEDFEKEDVIEDHENKKDNTKIEDYKDPANNKPDENNLSMSKEYDKEDIVSSIDPNHFGMSISADGLTLEVENSDNNKKMSYSVFLTDEDFQKLTEAEDFTGNFDMDKIIEDGGYTFSTAVYQIDGEAYCYSNMSGTDEYFKINDPNSETTQSFFTDVPETEEMGMDVENIGSVEYIETITYKDLYVDVVKVTGVSEPDSDIAPETFDMYIDPETGRAVAMVMHEADEFGNDMIIDISLSLIELPIEFEGCGEDTSTKAAEYLFGVMVLPMIVAE